MDIIPESDVLAKAAALQVWDESRARPERRGKVSVRRGLRSPQLPFVIIVQRDHTNMIQFQFQETQIEQPLLRFSEVHPPSDLQSKVFMHLTVTPFNCFIY